MSAPTPQRAIEADTAFTPASLAASFVMLFVLGGGVSLYGPSLSAFADRFDASLAVVGTIPPAGAVASFFGVTIWGALDQRVASRTLIATGAGTTATGALLLGLGQTFSVGMVGGLLLGGGFGLMDSGINTRLARDARYSSAALLNALHGTFGVGAVAFPLLYSVTGDRIAWVTVGLIGATATPLLLGIRGRVVDESWADDPGMPTGRAKRRLLIAFLVLYFAYLGIEAGAGTWMASALISEGMSDGAAARWTSAFWLVFTASRFVTVPLARRVSARRLVVLMALLTIPAALLTGIASLQALPYLLLGAAASPIFPSGLVWLAKALPNVRRGTSYVMMAAGVGAAVVPAGISAGVGWIGLDAVTYGLLLSAVATGAAAVAIRRRTAA